MKFTFSWLQKYLKTNQSLDSICERLTMLGIEVSEVIDNQNFFKQFKIVEVKEVQDHPNADRLKLCKINDGQSNLNIVCGAKIEGQIEHYVSKNCLNIDGLGRKIIKLLLCEKNF